jgi:hypothetical protein
VKKLLVPSEDYPCTWSVEGSTVSGELTLVGLRKPYGMMFEAPGAWETKVSDDGSSVKTFSMHTQELPRLRGRLRTNHDVVLVDAEIVHVWPEQARVGARMALCGFDIPVEGEPLFSSVQFQVEGLNELAGTPPLSDVQVPLGSTDGERKFTATWNQASRQSWQSSLGDTVTLVYVTDLQLDGGYRYDVSAYPVIKVDGTPRTADTWIDEYVRPLAQIATFAMSSKQSVCWAELAFNREPSDMVQVFAPDFTQEPYIARSPVLGCMAPLLRLGPGGSSLVDLLSGWQGVAEKYDAFFDYLSTSLREDMTANARFRALVPAIESYHTTKYGDGPVSRADFKRRRKLVLAKLKETQGLSSDDVEWLQKWVSPIGSFQLQERLRQVVGELSPALQSCLRARTDPLPEVLRGIMDNPQDVWHVMGKARNNVLHGGEPPTSEQLGALTRLAHTVAVGLALNLLGVSDTSLVSAIDDDRWYVI